LYLCKPERVSLIEREKKNEKKKTKN
jgi:hypothetical protein